LPYSDLEPTGVVEVAPSLASKFMPQRKASPAEVLDALERLHRE